MSLAHREASLSHKQPLPSTRLFGEELSAINNSASDLYMPTTDDELPLKFGRGEGRLAEVRSVGETNQL